MANYGDMGIEQPRAAKIGGCLVCFLLLAYSSTTGAQTAPPPYLDPLNRTVWSDDKIGIRFTYPQVWEQAVSTQPDTRVVINWRLSKSKTLLTSCYLEAIDASRSSLARANAEEIKRSGKSIADSLVANMQKRAPDGELVRWKSAIQDGHPVASVIRKGTLETINKKEPVKFYSISTAWREHEINFECATRVFGPKFESIDNGIQLIERIEKGILHVLGTLQFDRQ